MSDMKEELALGSATIGQAIVGCTVAIYVEFDLGISTPC